MAVALVVGGCQSVRDLAGQGKRPPDEFTVYSRTPLSVPPDFNLLPPVAGAVPEATTARADARQALLQSAGIASPIDPGADAAAYRAGASAAAAQSPGLSALLDRTGGISADPNIRSIVNRETTILADADQSLTERLMFWSKTKEYGAVVDPAKEARRIQDNQALGKPIVAGATPTIERKPRALLEGIF
ncbi:MAG: DUF3035 domain-containing protein [Rhodospirillales bacterium]|nr:DUF3035 domain-containing protein [Rhodospirillales bacterium]